MTQEIQSNDHKKNYLCGTDKIVENLFADPWHSMSTLMGYNNNHNDKSNLNNKMVNTNVSASSNQFTSLKRYLATKPSLAQLIHDNNEGLLHVYYPRSQLQGQHEHVKLLYVLCTTMIGSKYIQERLHRFVISTQSNNNYNVMSSNYVYGYSGIGNYGNINFHNNGDNFNANMNNHINVNPTRSIICDFFDAISSFGHLLCIDKYGHYAIDKLLKTCYQCQIINVLENFMQHVIIPHFFMLMKHSFTCRIVQNMLHSRFIRLKIYVLTQLNSFFSPQQQQQQQYYQPHQPQCPPVTVVTVQETTKIVSKQVRYMQPVAIDTATTFLYRQADQKPRRLEARTAAHASVADNGGGKYELLLETVNHPLGNYVIQATIETACQLGFDGVVQNIFEFILQYSGKLACNRFGCRVVQSCIVSPNIPRSIKCRLFVNILKLLADVCNDEYGHYCVQKCCEHAEKDIKKVFVEQILFGMNSNVKNYANSTIFKTKYTLPNALRVSFENYISNVQNPNSIVNLSKFGFGKYSSTVCDTAFKYATDDQRSRLVCYLFNQRIAIKFNVLFGLVHHEYGNFVIKNIIKTLHTLHQNAVNERNNCINNGFTVNNKTKQREQRYLFMLNQMQQALNNVSEFMHNYKNHSNNKFSFAYNVLKLANPQNTSHTNNG